MQKARGTCLRPSLCVGMPHDGNGSSLTALVAIGVERFGLARGCEADQPVDVDTCAKVSVPLGNSDLLPLCTSKEKLLLKNKAFCKLWIIGNDFTHRATPTAFHVLEFSSWFVGRRWGVFAWPCRRVNHEIEDHHHYHHCRRRHRHLVPRKKSRSFGLVLPRCIIRMR